MARTPWIRWSAIGATLAVLTVGLVPVAAGAAATAPAPLAAFDPLPAGSSPTLVTWDHADAVATSGPIAGDRVRRSEFYDAAVATASAPYAARTSFVYMSVPRSGEGKIGYDEQDGAEFSADAGLTMSWSSFEYAEDVWVDVHLKTGQTISSADEVTIRPAALQLQKEFVDASTIRVKVPYDSDGLRFSVEFDPQLYTAYNDLSGDSGALTTVAAGNRAVHTEPRNAMLIFANPVLTGADAARDIPSASDGTIRYVQPGHVDDLDDISEEIVYFGPGVYDMGSTYHAVLPAQVKWVYLAPGAYVKGAFRFLHDTQTQYKVTGRGVLSGEQYVYEPDTTDGYRHTVQDNCHSTCVKMLQFESSNEGQTLEMEGVTINQPPYHSFVVYAHEDGTEVGVENFRMDVRNYKQVGSWYWQTDGIELYPDSVMKATFFHANDDVLKLYHSNVTISDTVIWKNENGPVFQWGWVPRDVRDVTVSDTDIIHNRMYWKDVKYNTCVFNSSTHWEDMNATDRADLATTVKNLTFTNTRVEGAVNCAIRVFALSNTENIEIDGFHIDEWNGLDAGSQASLLKRYRDRDGQQVSIGDEMSVGDGILLHDYTVGGQSILKAGDNWAAQELGRLNFDGDTWNGWNATADDEPTGTAPTLTVAGLQDGSTVASRTVTVRGATDAPAVSVAVNGARTDAALAAGAFTATVTLPTITNQVVVTATGSNGVKTVVRRTLTALGTKVGSLTDPAGDDDGPGTYTYPSDGAFNAGSFDLTGLTVYRDGDTVRFVTSTAGEIHNPWGGDGMSTQRLNIYLRDGDSTAVTPLLPGTNTSADGAWSYVIVADGRYADARFGGGLYNSALERVADVALNVDPSGKIIASVPAAALAVSAESAAPAVARAATPGIVDLTAAGYQVSIYSDAEDGEGVGNVRPVYAPCAPGDGCPDFVRAYRFTGGAGAWTGDVAERDTDTTDSNAIDIISGEAAQAEVMDWTRGPVVVPYVTLQEDPADPEPVDPGDSADPLDPPSSVGGEAAAAGGAADRGALAGTGGSSGLVLPLTALAAALVALGALLRRRRRRREASANG